MTSKMGLTKATIIEVNEGSTGAFLVPITFLAIAGFLLLLLHWVLTCIVLAICFALATTKHGMEIDVERQRIRKFSNTCGFKNGEWIEVRPGNKVKIRFSGGCSSYSSRYKGTSKVRTKTFDIVLHNGKGETEIYDFLEYSDAKLALYHIRENFEVDWADELQQKIIDRKEVQTER